MTDSECLDANGHIHLVMSSVVTQQYDLSLAEAADLLGVTSVVGRDIIMLAQALGLRLNDQDADPVAEVLTELSEADEYVEEQSLAIAVHNCRESSPEGLTTE